MKNCFVIGKVRSGTTVFKKMLSTHPEVVNYGEIFNESNDRSFFDFLKRQVASDPNALMPSQRIAVFKRYVAECGKETSSRDKANVLVMDVKYEQMHLVYKAWHNLNDIPPLLSVIKSEGWSVIDMRRRNILNLIISNEVAFQTGVYHVSSDAPHGNSEKITLDPARLDHRIKSVERIYKRLTSFFTGYRGYLELTYEDLFDSDGNFRQEVLGRVGEFLNLPEGFDPVPQLRKVLSSDPLDHIANADEVRLAMAQRRAV